MRVVGAAGYAFELRERIVSAVREGKSLQAVADQFQVSRDTVRVYVRKDQEGTLAERTRPTGRPRRVEAVHERVLLSQVESHPDATLHEHAQMLLETTGLQISYRTVARVFVRHRITHKKTLIASERSEELRTQFLKDIEPHLQNPECLVFLDECGFNTAMTRGYARAPSHQRAVGRAPRNWGKNQTLICAMRLTGPTAPFVLEGAVNGDIFVWYIREILGPSLVPGQVVVLDNLSAHRRAEVQELIEERGCTLLFLPPYSPDFNPIELMFSKLKALVRAGEWREVMVLIEGIGKALAAVTRSDIRGWIRHALPRVFL